MNGIIDFVLSFILGNFLLSLLIIIIALAIASAICHKLKKHEASEAVARPIGYLLLLLFFGYTGSCSRNNERLAEEQMRAEEKKRVHLFYETMATAERQEKDQNYEAAIDSYDRCIKLHIVKPDLVSRAKGAKAQLLATCPDSELVRRHNTPDIEPLVEKIKARIEQERRCRTCQGTGRNTVCRRCNGEGKATCFFCGGKRRTTEFSPAEKVSLLDGKRYVDALAKRDVDCKHCDASGRGRCIDCNGSGKAKSPSRCFACLGLGYIDK